MKVRHLLLSVLAGFTVLSACNKGSDDPVAVVQKPRLNTKWVYQLDTYNSGNTSFSSSTVTHRATSEVTLGGETWLRITDDTMGLVYLLNAKTGGIYQYDNGASNLYGKYPGAVNDTYVTSNGGESETFTVKQTNLSLGAASGAEFYNITMAEGIKNGVVRDQLWYNDEAWIARRESWIWYGIIPYLRRYRWILQSISY